MNQGTVHIAVATFKRSAGLKALLESLEVAIRAVPDITARIVVVDNDPEGSARDLCSTWPERLVSYLSQPQPGISLTRNTGVRASLNADFVVFVDDDEVVEEQWLTELLRVQRETGADMVAGSVSQRLPKGTSYAVRRSRLFEPDPVLEAEELTEASTGNLLCTVALFSQRPETDWFQLSYGLSGGSDAELTRRFTREGARIVGAANARVWEDIPEDRANFGWLGRRYRRVGAIDYRLSANGRLKRARGLAGGATRIASGALGLAWSWFAHDRQVDAASFRRLYRGIGFMEAATVGGYVEYQRGKAQ